MTPAQLTALLREKAEKATPGPWTAGPECVFRPDGRSLLEVWVRTSDGAQAKADVAHIAAANPATLIALLDHVAALEARLADYARPRQAGHPKAKA